MVPSWRVSFSPQNLLRLCHIVLPFDLTVFVCSYSDFHAYIRSKKNKTYICKPDTGCQGKGIFITRSTKDIQAGEHMICQVYIARVRP